MGDFKIVIHGFGNHGADRTKKDGEAVDFNAGGTSTPDALAKEFVEKLKANGVTFPEGTLGAKFINWPGNVYNRKKDGPVDDLLTGIRSGSF